MEKAQRDAEGDTPSLPHSEVDDISPPIEDISESSSDANDSDQVVETDAIVTQEWNDSELAQLMYVDLSILYVRW